MEKGRALNMLKTPNLHEMHDYSFCNWFKQWLIKSESIHTSIYVCFIFNFFYLRRRPFVFTSPRRAFFVRILTWLAGRLGVYRTLLRGFLLKLWPCTGTIWTARVRNFYIPFLYVLKPSLFHFWPFTVAVDCIFFRLCLVLPDIPVLRNSSFDVENSISIRIHDYCQDLS